MTYLQVNAHTDARGRRRRFNVGGVLVLNDTLTWSTRPQPAHWLMTTGRGGIENKHPTDVESRPRPPRKLLRTCSQPTLNLLLLLRMVSENKHPTGVESHPPPSHVCMSIHPEGKSCSDLGRVLVLNDPSDWLLPDWLVYHELITTSRPFLRSVCRVEEAWLAPLMPRLHNIDVLRLSGGVFGRG